jgi:hypothetical protein
MRVGLALVWGSALFASTAHPAPDCPASLRARILATLDAPEGPRAWPDRDPWAGLDGRCVAPALVDLARSRTEPLRRRAGALAALSGWPDHANPTAWWMLQRREEPPVLLEQAARTLARTHRSNLRPLARLLDHHEPRVQACLLEALAERPPTGGWQAPLQALSDRQLPDRVRDALDRLNRAWANPR